MRRSRSSSTTTSIQLDTGWGIGLRASRPNVFEPVDAGAVQRAVQSLDDAAVVEATSRLCFVRIPFNSMFDEVYRNLIVPAVSHPLASR